MKPRGLVLSNAQSLMRIDWGDGKQCEITLADLRAACPCALCIGDENTQRLTVAWEEPGNPAVERPHLEAEQLLHVGNYALQILWRDGHAGGIYSWEMLRRLCEDFDVNRGMTHE